MKKLLFMLTVATLFLFGCQKEKEPEPVYNDDLGGTEWKWIREGVSTYEITLKFINNKNVNATKNFFGIIGTFPYDYTYSDKNKSGIIKKFDSDGNDSNFTISGNVLIIGDRRYYKK